MLWIGLPLLALGLLLGAAVLLQAWRDHREALEAERRWRAAGQPYHFREVKEMIGDGDIQEAS